MEKIEKMKKKYSQKERNMALQSALDSENSILIELALELEPDISVAGGKLLNYAILEGDTILLRKLLGFEEIRKNDQIMNEAIRVAVSLESTVWITILKELLLKGANKDVALQYVLIGKKYPRDVSIDLIRKGAKVFISTIHIERHYEIVEEIFKLGYGQSIRFSTGGLEEFCSCICKNNRKAVVKRLIKDRPDLVEKLTEVAITGGYTATLKLLHQEKAVTTIGEEMLDKAIRKKRYFTVKYIVENALHEVSRVDIVSAAVFGSVKTLLLLVEKDVENQKKQGNEISDTRYAKVISIAKTVERLDSVKALLDAGYNGQSD